MTSSATLNPSVAILPLGYRQPDKDWLVNLAKVRRPREQFITEV